MVRGWFYYLLPFIVSIPQCPHRVFGMTTICTKKFTLLVEDYSAWGGVTFGTSRTVITGCKSAPTTPTPNHPTHRRCGSPPSDTRDRVKSGKVKDPTSGSGTVSNRNERNSVYKYWRPYFRVRILLTLRTDCSHSSLKTFRPTPISSTWITSPLLLRRQVSSSRVLTSKKSLFVCF